MKKGFGLVDFQIDFQAYKNTTDLSSDANPLFEINAELIVKEKQIPQAQPQNMFEEVKK